MNLPFRRPGGGRASEFDARPVVAIQQQDRTGWWFAGGALVAASLLFMTLEARRQAVQQAAPQASGELASPQAIPDLVMPMPVEVSAPPSGAWLQPGDARELRPSPLAPGAPRAAMAAPQYPPQAYDNPYMVPPPQAAATGPGTMPPPPPASFDQPAEAGTGAPGIASGVRAGRLSNPSTTVIQGTLINAVLETAIDSTSPGQTRAMVTRDVYGFDGTRVLVPRGTRLYGIYESDVALGQKRAQIRWTRLLTPKGVTVALDSPAADPLGRAGVEARVNNHFMQRLGNALLGTASAVGSTLVTRNIGNSPVVVAVPGGAQAATQMAPTGQGQITPTLTVQQGKRISVFVQHDLDFSSVGEASGQ